LPTKPSTWLECLYTLPAPARLSGVAALSILAFTLTVLLPDVVSEVHLQLFLLAAVLLTAVLFGLTAGLVGATLGLGFMLWRATELTAASGWAIGFQPAFDAFLWFAVTKLAVALIAAPRTLVTRFSKAERVAGAEAQRQELLLSELSHRVRNDLHSLVAMLQMQAAADPESAEALHAAAGRVLVLSWMYRRLSRGKEAGEAVDSRMFLEGLVADLRGGMAGLRPVALTVAAEAHPLPLARAGDVGLVVNELVTNALKHAFPNNNDGVVRVTFRRDQGSYVLIVADNGVGTTPGRPAGGDDDGGLGSQILRALAAQLGGRGDMARGEVGGTVCQLRFPVSPPAPGRALPAARPVAVRHKRHAGPGRAWDGRE